MITKPIVLEITQVIEPSLISIFLSIIVKYVQISCWLQFFLMTVEDINQYNTRKYPQLLIY